MSDLNPNSLVEPSAKPSASQPKFDPVKVHAALASWGRWPIMKLLADGREMTITEAAGVARCTRENMGKHMLVLLKAGLVEMRFGEDRRFSVYHIPAALRPAPGVLDVGFCRIDFGKV